MDRLDTQERYLKRLLDDMSMEDLCEFFLDTMNADLDELTDEEFKEEMEALCPEVLN